MLKIFVKYLSKSIGPFFFEGSCCTSFGFSWFVIGRPPKAPVDISLSETGVQRHEEMNETNETEHPNCSLDPNKGELCLTTTLGYFFLNRKAWKKKSWNYVHIRTIDNSAIHCLVEDLLKGSVFFCDRQRVFVFVGVELLNASEYLWMRWFVEATRINGRDVNYLMIERYSFDNGRFLVDLFMKLIAAKLKATFLDADDFGELGRKITTALTVTAL